MKFNKFCTLLVLLIIKVLVLLVHPCVNGQQIELDIPIEEDPVFKTLPKNSSNNIDVTSIIGGGTPEDFINFMNSAPSPSYTGDATYSIKLLDVKAGGGLDYPLMLTYNSNRVRANMRPGIVGMGWDINIGEVSRSFNIYPDEQNKEQFSQNTFNVSGTGLDHSEYYGMLNYGDNIATNNEGSGAPIDEWDNYNVSTPYHNSAIVPIIPNGGIENYFIERPYKNWIIDYEKDGNSFFEEFTVWDEYGREFQFDHPHYLRWDLNGNGIKDSEDDINSGINHFIYYKFPISWKLSRINSPNSSHFVEFHYNNFAHADFGETPYSEFGRNNDVQLGNRSLYNYSEGVVTYDHSFVEEIETRTHEVKFYYWHLNDNPKVRYLSKIEVFSKSSELAEKVIVFLYEVVDHPTHTYSSTLYYNYDDLIRLESVQFHTRDMFIGNTYETYFSMQQYEFTYYEDEAAKVDLYSFADDMNLLKKIILPTGGTIEYEYEPRSFSYWNEIDDVNIKLFQKYSGTHQTSSDFTLMGTRVSKITLSSGVEESPDIERVFTYGDGVRLNNSYRELLVNNSVYRNQSSLLSGTVGHRWVEIEDSQGGFTRNYYLSPLSNSTKHPEVCNETNSDCTGISEEEALSVYYKQNPYSTDYTRGNYHNYNEAYGTIYKSEEGYYDSERARHINRSTNTKWAILESDFKYPSSKIQGLSGSLSRHSYNSQKSYLFTKIKENISFDGIDRTTLYSHFTKPASCSIAPIICRNVFFNASNNALHGLVLPPKYEITFDPALDEPIIKENVYLGDVYELALTEPYNMIANKVGEYLLEDIGGEWGLFERTKANHSGEIDSFDDLGIGSFGNELKRESGSITYWDVSDNNLRPRETWVQEIKNENYLSHSSVSNAPHCISGNCDNLAYTHNGIMEQAFTKYSMFGDLLEVTDVNSIQSSISRNELGIPTGVFLNAEHEDVYSHSFALSGLNGWAIKNYNNANSEFKISDKKLYLRNFPSALDNEFDAIIYDFGKDLNSNYIYEFDIKIENTDDLDLVISLGNNGWDGYISGNGAVWTAIDDESWKIFHSGSWHTIYSNLEVGKTYRFKMKTNPTSNKIDFYVNGELVLVNASFTNNTSIYKFAFSFYGYNASDPEWHIDNFRVYPETATAKTSEVDNVLLKPLTLKEIDGTTTRFNYNYDGSLKEIFKNKELIASYNYGNSRNRSNETLINDGSVWYNFRSNDPNFREKQTLNDQLFHNDFTSSLGFNSTGSAFFNHTQYDLFPNERVLKLSNEASVSKSFNEKNIFARIDLINWSYSGNSTFEFDGEGNLFRVKVFPVPDPNGSFFGKIMLEYKINGGSISTLEFPIHSIDKLWYTIELEKKESNLTAWVFTRNQGRQDANSYTIGGFNVNWTPDIRIQSASNTTTYVDNLYVSKSRKLDFEYFDGLGRPIQKQTQSINERIVTGQLYDERGLPIVTSRPISEYGTSGFISDLFGTSFNPGSALSGTEIEEYYDPLVGTSDGAYAYSYTQYEDSKTNRILSTTLPGEEHRFGNNNENNFSFDTNSVSISTPNKTWTSGNLYKTISIDPENKQSISYTNYLGQTVASGVDWDSDGELNGADDLVTTFEYDYNGNLILVEDPKGLLTTYNYNALGELLEKKLPDQDHPNKYCYDDKGRLRFHADPNDLANPFYYSGDQYSYTYTKYDEFDRPTEIGDQDAAYTSSNSQASFDIICANSSEINDQNEPSANNNPMIIYSYDGEDAASGTRNHKGRISRIQYKDPNTSSWGYTWYSYNELGLVEMIRQRMPGQNNYTDRTISYTYDELGRLVHVAYDEGYSSTGDHHFWYYYDGFGRLSKITSHQTNSPGSATTEAEYTYYADGQVEQLILGDGVQTIDYDYTIQGWLEDINNGTSGGGDVFSTILEYDLSGNIAKNTWYQKGWHTSGLFPAYNYEYDNANRLEYACHGNSLSTACPETSMSDFDVAYDYDKSGNLRRISRLDDAAHEMEYTNELESGTNKIDYVSVDGISGATQPQTKQFIYDANGNVIENELQGITDVTYDWRNLPTKVIANGTTINYTYDAEGNRVKKEVFGGETTYYIRGVDGQTFAAYTGGTIKFLNILAGGEIIGQIIKN